MDTKVDLTKLTAPFGLLDEVYGEGTQEALKAHGGPYESYSSAGYWFELFPYWCGSMVYRVKPQPLTKPSPPWEHLADWVQYVARDVGGAVYGYPCKPALCELYWDASGCTELSSILKFDPGTCDWKDSLVKRPEDK